MFWSKKEPNTTAETHDFRITTIPSEFYGGQNPVIKFKSVEKSISPEDPKIKMKTQPKITDQNVPRHINLFASKGFLFSAAAGLFLIFSIGAGFYYWSLTNGSKPQDPVKPPPKIEINNPPPVENTPIIVPSTTPDSATTTSTVAIKEPLIEFPSILLRRGEDMDGDGLTDLEEELFQTEPGKPDTDNDSYEDRTELYNLYSPTVFAPMRLSKTPSIKDFENPVFNYKVYYPSSWAVGNVDQNYRQVLFSTITGENIEIRTFDRKNGQTFEDWFSEAAPEERIGSLMDFETVFKSGGLSRTDNLVYYFEDDEHFYVLVYHVTNSDVVNHRGVIQMMARSFRFNNVDETLPEQKIIEMPSAEEATS